MHSAALRALMNKQAYEEAEEELLRLWIVNLEAKVVDDLTGSE